MTAKAPTYSLSDRSAAAVAETAPFTIQCGGRAVVKRNANGTHQYMTYRTLRRAEIALGAVKAVLPQADIIARSW